MEQNSNETTIDINIVEMNVIKLQKGKTQGNGCKKDGINMDLIIKRNGLELGTLGQHQNKISKKNKKLSRKNYKGVD